MQPIDERFRQGAKKRLNHLGCDFDHGRRGEHVERGEGSASELKFTPGRCSEAGATASTSQLQSANSQLATTMASAERSVLVDRAALDDAGTDFAAALQQPLDHRRNDGDPANSSQSVAVVGADGLQPG
jgi:hypothetical protein